MKVRWVILFLPFVSVIAISLAVREQAAKAASAQKAHAAFAANVKSAETPTTPVSADDSGPLTIPDTTLAINSDKPMSERVVHYEIDAKYDATQRIR